MFAGVGVGFSPLLLKAPRRPSRLWLSVTGSRCSACGTVDGPPVGRSMGRLL